MDFFSIVGLTPVLFETAENDSSENAKEHGPIVSLQQTSAKNNTLPKRSAKELTLNTDIDVLLSDDQSPSGLLFSSTLEVADYPISARQGLPVLEYGGILFTSSSITIPVGREIFIPKNDIDRYVIDDDDGLLAIVEGDRAPVFQEGTVKEETKLGTALRSGIHLLTGPTRFHVFLRMINP